MVVGAGMCVTVNRHHLRRVGNADRRRKGSNFQEFSAEGGN